MTLREIETEKDRLYRNYRLNVHPYQVVGETFSRCDLEDYSQGLLGYRTLYQAKGYDYLGNQELCIEFANRWLKGNKNK